MPCCCMNDFASLSADFTTPHFSADLPHYLTRQNNLYILSASSPYSTYKPLWITQKKPLNAAALEWREKNKKPGI